MGTLHDPVPAEVDETIRVNLMGPFWGASQAVRTFLAQGTPGSIVTISSIHARAAFNGFAAYDVAKGGVSALTRYLASEYGPFGIRANAIEPGGIRTAMNAAAIAAAPDPAHAAREMAALHLHLRSRRGDKARQHESRLPAEKFHFRVVMKTNAPSFDAVSTSGTPSRFTSTATTCVPSPEASSINLGT